MKKLPLLFTFSLLLYTAAIHAQSLADTITPINNYKAAAITGNNLVKYYIPLKKTTHILSPEPILYVDISCANVEGDLPEKNIFRLKPDANILHVGDNFQVTIVTASFVEVYDFTINNSDDDTSNAYVITINPNDAVQVNNYDKVGEQDFYRLSTMALAKKKKINNVVSKKYGMQLNVNNIFIVGDFLLFDISCSNKTKLSYAIDGLRFKLQDKHKVNAHISQEIELKPVYEFYSTQGATVKNKWRNFYLFRKFNYPGEKVLNIELTEKQLSGRKVEVNVDYGHILESDFLL